MAKVRKPLGWLRDAWLILGASFLVFLLLEVVLSVGFRFRDDDGAVDAYTVSADASDSAPWLVRYDEEFRASRNMRWVSYVYWRRSPYAGRYINVDSRGIRRTWSLEAEAATGATATEIFFLGGSTMWGTGARDEFTIPSIFAKGLAAAGIHATTSNLAETGYVSTQEIVFLMRELQQGNVPDLVVFYDGVNDTFSAYQQERAGLPQNEFNRAREFNASRRIAAPALLAINNLSTVRLARGVLRRLTRSDRGAGLVPDDSRLSDLATGVVDTYEGNIRLVEALAEAYSFKALFYWQPTIFQKRELTDYEAGEKGKRLALEPFFGMTYGVLAQRTLEGSGNVRFRDLSDAFVDTREPLFFDWCHLTEDGNERIAEMMVADALSIMEAEWPSGPIVGER